MSVTSSEQSVVAVKFFKKLSLDPKAAELINTISLVELQLKTLLVFDGITVKL